MDAFRIGAFGPQQFNIAQQQQHEHVQNRQQRVRLAGTLAASLAASVASNFVTPDSKRQRTSAPQISPAKTSSGPRAAARRAALRGSIPYRRYPRRLRYYGKWDTVRTKGTRGRRRARR